MYRVILVDDESIVLEGLQRIIDWKSLGYQIIATADDGSTCLKLLETITPDLIITDIKMRKMDGIELIESIRNMNIDQPKVIFLTGYNEFSYAKEALRYRARNYILKPIVEDELVQSLVQVKKELDKEKSMSSVIDDYRKIHIQSQITGLLEQNTADESLEYLFNNTHLDRYDFYRCGIVRIRPAKTNEISLDKVRRTVEERCNEAIDSYGLSDRIEGYLFRIKEHSIGMLLAYHSDYEIHEYIERLSERLKNMLPISTAHHITVSYGKKVKQMVDFHLSYKTAIQASKFMIYYDSRTQITYSDIKQYTINKIDYNKLIPVDKLIKAVITNEYDAIYSFFSLNFMVFKKDRVSIDDIIIFINKIFMDCTKELKEYCPEENYSQNDLFYSIKERMPSLSILMKEVLDFALWVSDTIKESGKKSTNKDDIVDYINAYFRENITLKMIAEKFYVNPVYLGQVLQKKLKIGFKKYLENLRMEESKKLLKTTDKPIYEIAFEVGYNDPEYFSRVFYKAYGVTPSQYKQQ